jgi:hypothetical protein
MKLKFRPPRDVPETAVTDRHYSECVTAFTNCRPSQVS